MNPDERIVTAAKTPWVETANGRVKLADSVCTNILALQEQVEAYVCNNSSNVLSLGQLCRILGCSFTWSAYDEMPTLRDPHGNEIDVWCEHDVPYFDPYSMARVLAVAGDAGSTAVEVSEYGDGRGEHPDAACSGGQPVGEEHRSQAVEDKTERKTSKA